MLSTRRIRANRQNARNSCGPKTFEGKRRSSRNATRHGLNLINQHNPKYTASIRSLAESLCGAYADRELLEAALIIAETQFVLAAVRQQVVLAIEGRPQAFSSRRHEKLVGPLLQVTRRVNIPPRNEFEAIAKFGPMLLRLDRYARRASSWRRKAFHQFVKRRNELDEKLKQIRLDSVAR